MKTVSYYMKGEPKQYAKFDTLEQAQIFMLELNENPNCESYLLEK